MNLKVSSLSLLLLLSLLCWPVAAQTTLLENSGFEEGIDEASGLPTGWSLFNGEPGVDLKLSPAEGEGHVFSIVDTSTSSGYGIRSVVLPASPGETYKATARVRTENGGTAHLYLDFWHEGRSRSESRSVSSSRDAWTTVTSTLTAPQDARWVSVILYSLAASQGTAHFDDITLERVRADQWSEEDMDAIVGDDQLDYAPKDGTVVSSNPPAFVWVPVGGAETYMLEYSPNPAFPVGETVRVSGIDLSVYTPPTTLDDAQTWHWRVFAVDANGQTSPPSAVRSFEISPSAVETPLPDLVSVRSKIPQTHPRLFITSDTLSEVRQARRSDMLLRFLADSIIRDARSLVYAPLPQEPPHTRPNGVWDVNLWREYRITVNATNNMTALAFAYLLTGDTSYGDAARKLMLHIASWDPNGATSAAVNDESSMPILYQMSRAYTWVYDLLTPEDRQVIQEVMRIRGNEAYEILKRRPFESRPYGSHAGRSLGFLGEAGIAFLGEIPEASEWFDYVTKIFYSVYPAWGKDAGGWAEGHAYWTSYMNRVLWFVDALKVATGLDLYEKAFFQNTGMFKLYTHPPYTEMGPFGDFADRGPQSADGNVMSHFAGVYDNPYYKWYANEVGAIAETGVMGFIRAYLYPRAQMQGKAPTDLPNSAYFSDVGWVALHKEFGEPRNSIQFMFKSSPYGSFSHSLADQNTFTLEAYGEPLAISSGYRPWYGSLHHMGWTKTTQAHNGLLISGEGQIPQSLSAKGRITGFLNGDSFDYTAGDAAQAYGSKVNAYSRHVVYLRPDVFVIFDDVRAPQAEEYSWLLHAYHPFAIDEKKGHIRVEAETANLDVHLWASEDLTFKQTDEFAVPLDEPMNKPTQWHLTASTQAASTEAYFLAVLVPSKAGEARPIHTDRLGIQDGEGVRLRDTSSSTTVLFATGGRRLNGEGLTIEGKVGAWKASSDDSSDVTSDGSLVDPSDTEGILLVDGTLWQAASGTRFESSIPVDAEMSIRHHGPNGTEVTGMLDAPAGPGTDAFDVSLHVPGLMNVSSVDSSHEILSWSFTEGELRLRLAPGVHQFTVK